MANLDGVPLLDVGRSNAPLRDEILQAFADVLDSGRFLHGPQVSELEAQVARHCDANHAIGCASGSDALLLCLMALGVGPGDEVITPSFTFFATVGAIVRLGATPVFADIDPETFNIDPASIRSLMSDKTKVILPVHLFGQSAAMKEVMEIAESAGVPVIEDAAQAVGARYEDRGIGSVGLAGCISFYPTKNLGGLGDGGMVVTNNLEFAEQIRLFAAHGMSPRYVHKVLGINSRLDTLQAAALSVKMKKLDQWTTERIQNAERYQQLFAERGLDEFVKVPVQKSPGKHVWNQFTIRVGDGLRDALRESLRQQGVGVETYYPIPVHQQKCIEGVTSRAGSLVETERASEEVLSLPIFPGLAAEEQVFVADAVQTFFRNQQSHAA